MNYTKTSICNLALGRIGARGQVVNIETENSPNAVKCNVVWDAIFQELLSERDWKFAKTRTNLELSPFKPLYAYRSAWALPGDFLRFVRPHKRPPNHHEYGWLSGPEGWGWYHRTDPPFWPHNYPYIIETLTTAQICPCVPPPLSVAPQYFRVRGALTSGSAAATMTVSGTSESTTGYDHHSADYLVSLQAGTQINLTIAGTFVSTIYFEASPDGSKWTATDPASTIVQLTTTFTLPLPDEFITCPPAPVVAPSGKFALTDYDGCHGSAKINYIRLITDYNQLMPGFVNCLANRLAMELSIGITEDKAKFQLMEERYKDSLNSAEAQNETSDFQHDETGSESWERAGRYCYGRW